VGEFAIHFQQFHGDFQRQDDVRKFGVAGLDGGRTTVTMAADTETGTGLLKTDFLEWISGGCHGLVLAERLSPLGRSWLTGEINFIARNSLFLTVDGN